MNRITSPSILSVELERTMFQRIVETSTEGILTLDANRLVTFCNERMAEMLGLTTSDLLGKPLADFIHPEDRQEFDAHMLHPHTGISKQFEHRYRRHDGTTCWCRMSAQPILDEQGRRIGSFAMLTDITDLKNSETDRVATIRLLELLNSSSDLHGLMKAVLAFMKSFSGCDAVGIRLRDGEDYPYFETQGFPAAFVEKENRLCATDLNGQLLRDALGHPIIECMCGNILCGRFDPTQPFFTPNGSFWSNCTTQLLASTSDADRQARTRNRCNGEGYESVALVPLRIDNQALGLLQFNDKRRDRFTPQRIGLFERFADSLAMALAHRQAQAALQRERDKAQSYLDIAAVMLVGLNPDQTIALANRKACDVLKYADNAMTGQNWFDLCLPASQRDTVKQFFSRMIRGEIPLQEYYENSVLTRTSEERMIAWHNSLVRDPNGKIIGTLSSGTDITNQRQAETREKELREKLANAARMESLGVLAGGVAHDLNNVLTPSIALPDIVEEYLTRRGDPQDPDLASALEAIGMIRNSSRRAAAVVKDLVVMGRRGHFQPERVNLNKVIHQTLHAKQLEAWHTLRPEVAIVARTAETDVACMGSESHLVRVTLNLIGNAVEAINGRGEVTIEVASRTLHQNRKGYDDIPPGHYAVLTVSDTGCGMSRTTLDRIFEPFFTTKAPNERSGSGLGLSVVHGLVRDHNGFIDITSAPGAGTTFAIYFPAAPESTSQPAGQSTTEPRKGNERILTVDDEPSQLTILRMVLSKLGYRITGTTTGHDAVQHFELAKQAGAPAPFDLAIIDMRLHDTDGATVLQQIKALYPAMKAIAASGDAPDEWAERVKQLGADWLAKPFTAATLAHAVRRRLDRD